MWIKIVNIMLLHVAIQSPDHDGVTNQLMFSQPDGKGNRYAISLSTDKPLPFETNKWFKAETHMECQTISEQIKSGVKITPHICNASKIIVNGTTYEVSNKRRLHDGEGDKSFGEEKAVTRKER